MRWLIALALVALALVLLWPSAPSDTAHDVFLVVTSPAGDELYNGSLAGATVLDALRASGLQLQVTGGGCSAYVAEIAGYAATGRSGWVYETNDGSGWQWALVSAGCMNTTPHMQIRWHWDTV